MSKQQNSNSTDPYFIVRDEVMKSLDRANNLSTNSRDQETLRTILRSIEWDLEDLEETVNIVENSRSKFSSVTDSELHRRRAFILESKQEIKKLRQGLTTTTTTATSNNLTTTTTTKKRGGSGGGGANNGDNPSFSIERDDIFKNHNHSKNHHHQHQHSSTTLMTQTQEQQQFLLHAQDERLDELGDSLKVLKHASKTIANEMDDQAVLLDNLGDEMTKTQNRLDVTSKKLARVLRMSTEKRQWFAIIVLLVTVIILIILLAVL